VAEPIRPSFRKNPVPQPSASATSGKNMPIRTTADGGTLPIQPVVLTEWDKEQLRVVGWEEGQAIPPDFAQQIKQVQLKATADEKEAVQQLIETGRSQGGRVKVGKTLDLRDLPQEQQEELRKTLADYQEHVKQAAARPKPALSSADPSVQAAYQKVTAAEMPEVEIKQASNSEPEQNPEAAPVTSEVQNTGMDAGGAPAVTHCPRCLWDVRVPWELKIEDADKQQFVAAILGGTRFTKTVPTLDGQLLITYRTLTSRETDLVFKQLGHDLRKGRITDDGQYLMQLQVYRLVLSVERIENGQNGSCIVEIPPVFELDFDSTELQQDDTQLVQLVDWFNDKAVVQESLRRIVAQHHRRFQRLVEGLEVVTGQADF